MNTRIQALAALFIATTFAQAAEPGRHRFTFGTARPAPDFTSVTPATLFTSSTSFGFDSAASLKAQSNAVTSDQPFLFSIKLPEGNYTITATLGNDAEDSTTTIKAEARRLMLENIRVSRGASVTRTFAVNIRTPRIPDGAPVRLKQREKETEKVTWDDALTLEFNGIRPSLRTLEIAPAPSLPTVFLAGDSTVCDQPAEPWNIWGQMLPRFFKPNIAVANYAQSGESIKSSLGARRFDKIFSAMKRGDWLLVQFGHNDMKDRSTNALNTYRANLKKIVAQARARGGTPVLVTSMERRAGVAAPTLAGYPDAVRAVAREDDVPLIDLHAASIRLYQALGPDLGKAFHDGTHHNNYGSYQLAKCVAAGIAAAKLDLAKSLVDDVNSFAPSHPDPAAAFNIPPSPAQSTAKPDGN